MNDDMRLLTDYALHGSEPAFQSLVSRFIDLVYSAALRQVHDRHLAEEVTQTTFLLLARKAASLGPDTIVPSWLYRTADYAARDVAKQRRRQQRRDQEAHSIMNEPVEDCWHQIAP